MGFKPNTKWILDVNRFNKLGARDFVVEIQTTVDDTEPPTFTITKKKRVNQSIDKYTVISNEFRSIVMNSEGNWTMKPCDLFNLSSRNKNSTLMEKRPLYCVNTLLLSYVEDTVIPIFVEEIPLIITQEIDLTEDVMKALNRNMGYVLRPLQIVPRSLTETPCIISTVSRSSTADLEKALDAFDMNTHSTLPKFGINTVTYPRDWSSFRDIQDIVEMTDDELRQQIAQLLSGNTRVFWIKNLDNVSDDAKELDDIAILAPAVKDEEFDDEVGSPGKDEYIYEDTLEQVDHQTEQLEFTVDSEPPETDEDYMPMPTGSDKWDEMIYPTPAVNKETINDRVGSPDIDDTFCNDITKSIDHDTCSQLETDNVESALEDIVIKVHKDIKENQKKREKQHGVKGNLGTLRKRPKQSEKRNNDNELVPKENNDVHKEVLGTLQKRPKRSKNRNNDGALVSKEHDFHKEDLRTLGKRPKRSEIRNNDSELVSKKEHDVHKEDLGTIRKRPKRGKNCYNNSELVSKEEHGVYKKDLRTLRKRPKRSENRNCDNDFDENVQKIKSRKQNRSNSEDDDKSGESDGTEEIDDGVTSPGIDVSCDDISEPMDDGTESESKLNKVGSVLEVNVPAVSEYKKEYQKKKRHRVKEDRTILKRLKKYKKLYNNNDSDLKAELKKEKINLEQECSERTDELSELMKEKNNARVSDRNANESDERYILINSILGSDLRTERKSKKVKKGQEIDDHVKFTCNHCDEQLSSKEKLRKHIRNLHLEDRYKPVPCDYCDRILANGYCLQTHISIVHLKRKPFSCHDCGLSFGSKASLKNHIEYRHSKIRTFQCDQCSWSFTNQKSLKSHMISHMKVKPFLCHHCSQSFAKKSYLKNHISRHTGERNFVCDLCGAAFTNKTHLQCHMKRHAGGATVRAKSSLNLSLQPAQCPYCDQKLAHASSLKRHIKTMHVTNEGGEGDENKSISLQAVECSTCYKTLPSPSLLRKHIRQVHRLYNDSKERSFACSFCCSKFTASSSLQRHVRVVHNNKKNEHKPSCPICKRRLANHVRIMAHMLLRHPDSCENKEAMKVTVAKFLERNIPCPICKRKYQTQTAVKKHLAKIHYDRNTTSDYEANIPCPICKRKILTKEKLREHMENRHNDKSNAIEYELPQTQ